MADLLASILFTSTSTTGATSSHAACFAQPAFQKQFQDTGFWSKDEGMLVIVSPDDALLGHIEFFKTVNYLDEYELSYQVYAPEQPGKGVATEAVQLLVRYLLKPKNDIPISNKG